MLNKVAIIGCGNIGEQVLKNLRKDSFADKIYITRRNRMRGLSLAKKYKVIHTSNEEAIKNAGIVWLCVRPSEYAKLLREIKPFIKNKIVISVAVDLSQKYVKSFCPKAIVIRYMPSLLIVEKKGIALLVKDKRVIPNNLLKSLQNWSTCLYIIKDNDMHLYTTIVASGSVFVVALLLNAISSVGGKVDKETFLKVVLESINFIKDKNIKDWQNIVNFAATPG